MTEQYVDIPGYEGDYQISNHGNVRSIKKMPFVILKLMTTTNGYSEVSLWLNGKQKKELVHRLVAECFLDNPHGYSEINHIDEDKQNNRVDNLEWCTHLYNMNYGNVRRKISEANKGKTSWNKGLICPQISERQLGKKHPHKSHPISDETRSKISRANKGRSSWNRSAVVKLGLDGEFIKSYNSLTEAGVDCKSDRHKIAEVCLGRRESLSGFRWKYARDYYEGENILS